MVYPEAAGEDEDRTSVTSQNEISSLVNSMAKPGKPGLNAAGEDYVSTQIAQGSDQARAMAALANELGDPMDMDGTVEIQNPMKVWQQAQAALSSSRAAAAAAPPADVPSIAMADADDDYDDDEFDHSPTEVVDVNALNFPFGSPAAAAPAAPASSPPPPMPSRGETYAPTQPQDAVPGHPVGSPQGGRPPEPAHHYPATSPNPSVPHRDSSPDLDSAFGSGQYAPNTPPGGRQTGESWDQPAPVNQQFKPQVPQLPPQPAVQQFAPQAQNQGFGNAGGFNRSPSGLTGAALFDDMVDEPAPSPTPSPLPPNPNPQGFSSPNPNMMQAAPQVAPPQAAPPQGGAGEHPGPWKLKTNFGLTYEFPDTRGLRSWLSSREELDGFTVSADDGATFHPLTNFPQLDRNAGRSPSMSGNMSMGSGLYADPTGSGQFGDPGQQRSPSQSGLNAYGSGLHAQPNPNPTTGVKGPRVNSEYRPPSRDKSKGILWLVFLLLAGIAVLIGLESFGVFSVTGMAREFGILPAAEKKIDPLAPKIDSKSGDPVEVDQEALAKKQAAEVEQLLGDAERLVKGNKLPAALDMLKTTEQLAPENPIVHDLKARVFDKLGKVEEAEASRAKAEQIRTAAEAPEGEEPAGEEPAGEEPEGEADPDKAE